MTQRPKAFAAAALIVLLATSCSTSEFPVALCYFGDLSIAGVRREYPDAGMLPVPVAPVPVEGTSYVDCTIPGVVPGEVGFLKDGRPFYADDDLRLYTMGDDGSRLMGVFRAGA